MELMLHRWALPAKTCSPCPGLSSRVGGGGPSQCLPPDHDSSTGQRHLADHPRSARLHLLSSWAHMLPSTLGLHPAPHLPLKCARSQLSLPLCSFCSFFKILHSMWDLSSPTRDWTHAPCRGNTRVLTTGAPGKSLCPCVLDVFITHTVLLSFSVSSTPNSNSSINLSDQWLACSSWWWIPWYFLDRERQIGEIESLWFPGLDSGLPNLSYLNAFRSSIFCFLVSVYANRDSEAPFKSKAT